MEIFFFKVFLFLKVGFYVLKYCIKGQKHVKSTEWSKSMMYTV